MRYSLLILAILYALVGAATAVRAQDATARSQKLFAAALEAKRAGDLPRALCLMQSAHSAWSNAAFSFNIAQLQRELGMCAEARTNYQAFLAHERDPARRKQAELALAELTQCTTRTGEPAAATSCAAWEADALGPSTPLAAANASPAPLAPTPTAVARAQVNPSAPQLIAAPSTSPSVRQYLPWIFAGVGVVCVAMMGYELAQIAAAERDLRRPGIRNEERKTFERDGDTAEKLSWVFAGGATLSLGSALILALTNSDAPPPSAAGK